MWMRTEYDEAEPFPHMYVGDSAFCLWADEIAFVGGMQAFFNEIDAQFWRDMYWAQMLKDSRKDE